MTVRHDSPRRYTHFGPLVMVCDLESRRLSFGGEAARLARELREYERAGRYFQLNHPLSQ